MRAHVWQIEIKTVRMVSDGVLVSSWDEYRWACSCERQGPWKREVRRARNGGVRHVAAQERTATAPSREGIV